MDRRPRAGTTQGSMAGAKPISASTALFISSDEAAKKLLKLWHRISEDWTKIYAEQDVG